MPIPTLPGITAQTVTSPRITTRVLFLAPRTAFRCCSCTATPPPRLTGRNHDHASGGLPRHRARSARLWRCGSRQRKSTPHAVWATSPTMRSHCSTRSATTKCMSRVIRSAGRLCGACSPTTRSASSPQPSSAPVRPTATAAPKTSTARRPSPTLRVPAAARSTPRLPQRMSEGDRSLDNPQSSPRGVMNGFYWKPPFVPPQ